jgi:hypothetical protein
MGSRKNRPVCLRAYVAPPLAEVALQAADEEGRSMSDWLRHKLVVWAAQRVTDERRAA